MNKKRKIICSFKWKEKEINQCLFVILLKNLMWLNLCISMADPKMFEDKWTVSLSSESDVTTNYPFPDFCFWIFLKFLIMALGHCFETSPEKLELPTVNGSSWTFLSNPQGTVRVSSALDPSPRAALVTGLSLHSPFLKIDFRVL